MRVELIESACASCLANLDHGEKECVHVQTSGGELTLCRMEHASMFRRAAVAGVFVTAAKTRCACCGERTTCEILSSAVSAYTKRPNQAIAVCAGCRGRLLHHHTRADHDFEIGDAVEWDPEWVDPPWWPSSMTARQRQQDGQCAQRYP